MKDNSRFARNRLLALGAVAGIIGALQMSDSPSANAQPLPTGPWVSIADARTARGLAEVTAAESPRPGVTIVTQLDADTAQLCTASWAVYSATGDIGFLTAGHCQTQPGASLWMFTDKTLDKRLWLLPLQNRERGLDTDGVLHDSAVFFLSGDQRRRDSYSTKIAPGVKLAGVLDAAEVRALPVGTPLCMNGSRSGLTCGPLKRAGTDEIEWGGSAVKGDSGAPVWLRPSRWCTSRT
ncbi:chymotrypsin family serine protease [Mycolicibacterium aubagnense]|uniref:hypothetical protein n=1 Tax=Mycolicibacterium aubagnense TaxID=319707 RepID=UPI0010FF0962|nr:hypothetical protein [Mycolicibacterium aubagnense]